MVKIVNFPTEFKDKQAIKIGNITFLNQSFQERKSVSLIYQQICASDLHSESIQDNLWGQTFPTGQANSQP